MTLQGKGFYIWKVPFTEGGDNQAILDLCKSAGLSHVLIKVANEDKTYNYDKQRRIDLVAPLARLLKSEGITVWGWQYIYGERPLSEARKAIQRVQELDLDGFVVNAEKEFKQDGKEVAARTYMTELRNALPSTTIVLSSYRFPSYHPLFPWKDFLEYVDINMPQVYWEGAHNPRAQLIKCVREFQNFEPYRPIIPTGAAYTAQGWRPTAEDALIFLQTVMELKLPAVNFWSWQHCRAYLPSVWDQISEFPWSDLPPEKDITEKYIDALNSRDPLNVVLLYTLIGAHVDTENAIQGPEKLLAWYHNFLNNVLPDATFELTGSSGTGNSRHMTWTATSSKGNVLNGNDTLGLMDGKISYHYTFFTVTPP
jgi:hypothetical protein